MVEPNNSEMIKLYKTLFCFSMSLSDLITKSDEKKQPDCAWIEMVNRNLEYTTHTLDDTLTLYPGVGWCSLNWAFYFSHVCEIFFVFPMIYPHSCHDIPMIFPWLFQCLLHGEVRLPGCSSCQGPIPSAEGCAGSKARWVSELFQAPQRGRRRGDFCS